MGVSQPAHTSRILESGPGQRERRREKDRGEEEEEGLVTTLEMKVQ